MASRKVYTAEEAANIINNWVNESDSDSDTDANNDTYLSESDSEYLLAEGEEDIDVNEGDSDVDPEHPIQQEQPTPAKKAKKVVTRKKKALPSQPSGDWFLLGDDHDYHRTHNFRFIPSKTPGVQGNFEEKNTPIDYFFELFPLEVQINLVDMINEFAAAKGIANNPAKKTYIYGKWKPINHYELIKFLAVVIAMGLDKKPSIKDYWSMNSSMYKPWFHHLFARDRFESIMHTMLHVSPAMAQTKAKIEPFINEIVKNFQTSYYPYQDVSIDEMVIKWKGRSKYKMYNPMEPEKYHIKTFGLCCATTGYAYHILPYFGAETDYAANMLESGMSEKIFEYLLRPLGPGHHIFADRYCTTKVLVEYLTAKNFYYTGTVQANRKGFLEDIKQNKKENKIAHMEHKFWRSETSGLLLVMWKDKKAKKPVVVVSSHGESGMTRVELKRTNKIVEKQALP